MTTTGVSKPRALPITVPPRPEALWPKAIEPTTTKRIHALVLVALIAGVGYLIWRVIATLSPLSLVLGIPLLVLEAWSLAALALTAFVLWQVDSAKRPDPVVDSDVNVVVLIPTVDEPFNTLLPSLTAAARMRLATRVIILDDGDRPWVKSMCHELGVEYRARKRHLDGRSGQLNSALATLDAEFVVILEPDQVVTRDMIGHLLPHFDDQRMAFVQAARDTFSMDSFEHVSMGRTRRSETAMRDRLMSAGRNHWNAAYWGGGAAILRVSAIDDIGGFAQGDEAAAMRTSIRMHAAGWKSLQHDEVLVRGAASADAAQYIDKTRREGRAALSALRSERFLLVRGLTWQQRLSYLQATTEPLASWRWVGYLLVPALALLLALTPATGPVALFVALAALVYGLRGIAYSAVKRDRTPHYLIDSLAIVRASALLGSVLALLSGSDSVRRRTTVNRSPRRVPLNLWLLALVNGAALAWAALAAAGIVDASYPFALMAVAAVVWCLVNIALVSGGISRIRSSVFGGDRRLAQRVEVEGHVYVDGQRVHVLDLSLTGLRALSYAPAAGIGEYCSVRFTDPNNRSAVVTGTVIGTTPQPHGTHLRIGLEPEQSFVIGAILAEAFTQS